MKPLPLILAFILLLPLLWPCYGMPACSGVEAIELEECAAAENTHGCCQLPAQEAPSSPDEDHDPCADGCLHYCCAPLMVAGADLLTPAEHPEFCRQSGWMENLHARAFAYLVWNPPKKG